MRYTTLLCIVPPYSGWGWQTRQASLGSPPSGSSISASIFPAPPSIKWDSIRRTAATSVCPEVDELHVDAEIRVAQELDRRLQRVAILPAHPHEVALDRSLHFQL